jgi:hypothetical protein
MLLGGGCAESPTDVHILDVPPRETSSAPVSISSPSSRNQRTYPARDQPPPDGGAVRFTGSTRAGIGFFDGGRTGLSGAVGSIGLQIGGGS